MANLILDMCYDAIFDGLPVMRLRRHQYFEWDHQRHNIHSLLDFYNNFETVLQIFHRNNFAEEYAGRWPAEAEGFAPYYSRPQLRHSTLEIERYFRGLREWIRRVGVDGVETRIEELFVATHQNRDAFPNALRALMLNPACTPCIRPLALPRRRQTDLSSLLHRMHSLRSTE